jgi:hypothetical protein
MNKSLRFFLFHAFDRQRYGFRGLPLSGALVQISAAGKTKLPAVLASAPSGSVLPCSGMIAAIVFLFRCDVPHISGAAVPSDHLSTGTLNSVVGSGPS